MAARRHTLAHHRNKSQAARFWQARGKGTHSDWGHAAGILAEMG